MQRMKKEGKAKHVGFSYHDTAENLDIILAEIGDWVEYVQLQLNYLDWESENVQSKLCYEVCKKYNKPVIVMEPVKGGTLVILTSDAITNYLNGIEPLKCGEDGFRANGNGSLMRILPLAYYINELYHNEDKEVIYKFVENLSSLTHRHDISKIACVLYIELVL